MPTNINCIFSRGVLCTNWNVKRTLLGFGHRLCTEYPTRTEFGCKHKILYEGAKARPVPMLPPAKMVIPFKYSCMADDDFSDPKN